MIKKMLIAMTAISCCGYASAHGGGADSAPKFRLYDGKITVRVGANIKATASFDWGSPLDDPNEFVVSEIPMHPEPGNGGKFQISAQQSGAYLDLRWLEGEKDQVRLYINGLLDGHDYTPEIEEAYLTYRGFKVGYAYGLFCDQEAVAPTIDHQGPNAFISVKNGVIDYEHAFESGVGVGIGAQMPIQSFNPGEFTAEVNNRVPDFPAYIQYAWGHDRDSWVRASAIMRTLTYRDLEASKNKNAIGWGVKLGGTAEITHRLRAYYEAAYGHGISSYFQDLTDAQLDLVPDARHKGKLKPVEAWGGYAGLKYDFSDRLFASASYSYLRLYPKNFGGDWSSLYRNGQYAVANVFYQINEFLQWGIEYIYGQKVEMSGARNHDNRLQTMLEVSF